MDLHNFQTQVLTTKNKLFRFARHMLGNPTDAEDAVQDVLMKMWDIREKLDAYHSVEALAMTITRNTCLGRLRKKPMLNLESQPEMPHFALPDLPLEQQDTKNLVQNAIKRLPDIQGQILQLRDIEEYEMEEIAEIIGKDEGYVRVNLCRARKKLKEILMQTR
ncbi:MAG: sigma-70 family RNA polymerase sigma factor [Verrucomicrobia bacterium]|nr:sigma-70 family RNA polymerase sigma factor [Cytophagales bacterium]